MQSADDNTQTAKISLRALAINLLKQYQGCITNDIYDGPQNNPCAVELKSLEQSVYIRCLCLEKNWHLKDA